MFYQFWARDHNSEKNENTHYAKKSILCTISKCISIQYFNSNHLINVRCQQNVFNFAYLKTFWFINGFFSIWIHSYTFNFILIHSNILWNIQIPSSTFKYIWIHSDTFEYILIPLNTFWYLWIQFDTFEYILIHLNTFWYIWMHSDTFRYCLIHYDTFRYFLIKCDTFESD